MFGCLFRVASVLLLLAAVGLPQDAPLTVAVSTAEGQRVEGRIESLAEGQLKLAGQAAAWKTADLFRVDWPQQPVHRTDSAPVLVFVNGDQAAVRPERISGEAVHGRWTAFQAWPEFRVPLEALRGCVFAPPVSRSERAKLFDRLMRRTEKTDALLLKNGDSLTGEFQSLSETGLSLKTATGTTNVAPQNVVSLAFNPELTLERPFKGEGALVTFVDGSRLHARALRIAFDGTLAFETAFGAKLEAPLTSLASLQFLGGKVIYVSDLEPAADKSQPYLGLTWPYRRDRSVTGGPLRIRETEFAKGLGVHSRSELSWKLDGQYRRFQATLGVDDDADGKGSVVFRVLVDGKPAFTSRVQTGLSDPAPLEPIDVTGAKTLTLVVEFATFGDVLDHADWADARLVR